MQELRSRVTIVQVTIYANPFRITVSNSQDNSLTFQA